MQTSIISRPLAARPTVARRGSRQSVQTRAAGDAPTWYPGSKAPAYLDGSMPGDYGFDPLRLGANPDALKWYQQAELYHSRFAMAAIPGILLTDAAGLPKWWEAGAAVELPFGGFGPLLGIQLATFAVLESFRWKNWVSKRDMNCFGPIAPFDPMGMASPEMQAKEIKNGRLAMVAFLGFASQAAVRGEGPLGCLSLHLENPGYNNIFTSSVGPEVTAAVIGAAITPVIIQARRAISGNDDEEFRPIPGPW